METPVCFPDALACASAQLKLVPSLLLIRLLLVWAPTPRPPPRQRHPTCPSKYLLDWNLAILTAAPLAAGITLGGLANKLAPPLVVHALALAVLLVASASLLSKTLSMVEERRRARRAAAAAAAAASAEAATAAVGGKGVAGSSSSSKGSGGGESEDDAVLLVADSGVAAPDKAVGLSVGVLTGRHPLHAALLAALLAAMALPGVTKAAGPCGTWQW
jgi:uncharacterized membrane protein YfcA